MKCPYCQGRTRKVCNGVDSEGKFALCKCEKCREVTKVRES